MRRICCLGILSVLMVVGSGCQCSNVRDRYGDVVDDVTDVDLNMEWAYKPKWDLNLVGRPEWCSSRLNRLICPKCWKKCQGCEQCQGEAGCVEQAYLTEEMTGDLHGPTLVGEEPGLAPPPPPPEQSPTPAAELRNEPPPLAPPTLVPPRQAPPRLVAPPVSQTAAEVEQPVEEGPSERVEFLIPPSPTKWRRGEE